MIESQRKINRGQITINQSIAASIKSLKMQVGHLFQQMEALANSEKRFNGNILDNPKNENCSAIGLRSISVGTATQACGQKKMSEDYNKESEKKEVVEGDANNKKNEREKGEIESHYEVKGQDLDQFIDKNSPNLEFPNYIKAPYPVLKKKHDKKDEKEEQFKNFKEMLQKIQVNVHFCKAMDRIPVYTKFMKEALLCEK